MATLERTRDNIHEALPHKLELGSFVITETPEARSTLVIASYNIRYAVGSYLITGSIGRRLGFSMPRRRPRLVEHNIATAAAAFSEGRRLPSVDILALQEADKHTLRAGGHHVAREMADRMRMHFAYAPSERPEGEEPKSRQWYLDFEEHIPAIDEGQTGVALVSRLPLSEVARIELPWHDCPWRPRLALAATVRSGRHSINLFNSHIDPHAEVAQQLEQHATVLARADEMAGPTVLVGDFNTLSNQSCVDMRNLLESRGFTTPFPTGTSTWRAGLIRLHTDWIFVRGASVKRYGVARPRGVSDHWPVWVEIDLDGDAN